MQSNRSKRSPLTLHRLEELVGTNSRWCNLPKLGQWDKFVHETLSFSNRFCQSTGKRKQENNLSGVHKVVYFFILSVLNISV